jgi:hypothetical protein
MCIRRRERERERERDASVVMGFEEVVFSLVAFLSKMPGLVCVCECDRSETIVATCFHGLVPLYGPSRIHQ